MMLSRDTGNPLPDLRSFFPVNPTDLGLAVITGPLHTLF